MEILVQKISHTQWYCLYLLFSIDYTVSEYHKINVKNVSHTLLALDNPYTFCMSKSRCSTSFTLKRFLHTKHLDHTQKNASTDMHLVVPTPTTTTS